MTHNFEIRYLIKQSTHLYMITADDLQKNPIQTLKIKIQKQKHLVLQQFCHNGLAQVTPEMRLFISIQIMWDENKN